MLYVDYAFSAQITPFVDLDYTFSSPGTGMYAVFRTSAVLARQQIFSQFYAIFNFPVPHF